MSARVLGWGGVALGWLLVWSPPSSAQEEGETPVPPVQDSAPVAAEPASEPAATPPPVFDHPFTLAELEASLAELVAAYPHLARRETIGSSRGGRAIPLLVLTDAAEAPAGEKPALAVVDHLGGKAAGGAEAGLALAWDLARRHGEEEGARRLLGNVTVYVLPVLDPDARVRRAQETPGPAPSVRFDRNFPVGWLPDTLRAESGNYPLSEPATLAAARFLAEHPDLVAMVGVGAESRDAPPLTLDPGVEDAAFLLAMREHHPDLVPAGESGTLFAHAYFSAGILPFLCTRAVDPAAPTAERVRDLAETIEPLVGELPHVTAQGAELTPRGPGVWQIDLVLENDGGFPTRSVRARSAFRGSPIHLGLEGAVLVAGAVREEAQGTYRLLEPINGGGGPVIDAGDLEGGGHRSLRLVVRGESGAEIRLVGRSPAARAVRLVLSLP